MQNSQLANLNETLIDIRSTIKEFPVYVCISSFVKQEIPMFMVFSSLSSEQQTKFLDYIVGFANRSNISIAFGDNMTFVDISLQSILLCKTHIKLDFSVDFDRKVLTLYKTKLMSSLISDIHPSLIDQYIKILQEKKLSA